MAKNNNKSFEEVQKIYSSYLDAEQAKKVDEAYKMALDLHGSQFRKSGESYIVHPIQVVDILTSLKMDFETLIAGFLHDVVEDTEISNSSIEEQFGVNVAEIVEGVTKINKIQYNSAREQLAENHRKLLLAMSKDIRVIIVKLADRLHNMRTLEFVSETKQVRVAKETLEIYAPLAHRLGLGTIKWELEDLSLRYIDPKGYHEVAQLMSEKREERLKEVDEAVTEIEALIEKNGLNNAEVYGRPKHIYSIYRKMHDKNKQFSEIYDLTAIRVLVETLADTYTVLGAIHANWKPMPGRFKDYIALPKPNGYQSLHTTIIGPNGKPIEVQIRTHEMHRIAEFGVAAHWAYKENHGSEKTANVVNKDQSQLNIVKGIIELQNETEDADEFVDAVQSDFFSDRVYAFTPKGEVFELPLGSGPLDMAFAIHTEIGKTTTGAKVNGKIVPLDNQLQTGDIVEIITSKTSKPSRDWLPLVKSRRARNKIKQYFREQDKEENIRIALEILEKELLSKEFEPKEILKVDNLDRTSEVLHYKTSDDMLSALGYGDIALTTLFSQLTSVEREKREKEESDTVQASILSGNDEGKEAAKTLTHKGKAPSNTDNSGVQIDGLGGMLIRLGKCCTPVPGDEIGGYITKGRGVSIHRIGCPNLNSQTDNGQRIISAQWINPEGDKPNFDADLLVKTSNKEGILNEIIRVINANTHYLNSINGKVDRFDNVNATITIGVRNIGQLTRIMDNIKNIPNVFEVTRPIH